jgi:integral membrane protein
VTVSPGAVLRFRVASFIVGALLVVLVCIGVPLNHLAHKPGVVAVVGPLHGVFFYPLYLLATFDLARRARWSIVRTLLVMLAGVVPFLTFVAEHIVTRDLRTEPVTAEG